jgi:hypothetical protein
MLSGEYVLCVLMQMSHHEVDPDNTPTPAPWNTNIIRKNNVMDTYTSVGYARVRNVGHSACCRMVWCLKVGRHRRPSQSHGYRGHTVAIHHECRVGGPCGACVDMGVGAAAEGWRRGLKMRTSTRPKMRSMRRKMHFRLPVFFW